MTHLAAVQPQWSAPAVICSIVPVGLGLTLITAALLKCYQLATSEVVSQDLFTSRSFLATLVVLELALGMLLVAGVCARLARWASLVCFIGFFERSMYLAMAGERSCGCLGYVDLWPWWSAGFAAVAALFLVVWRPRSESVMRAVQQEWYALLVGLAIIAGLALVGMTRYTPRGQLPHLRSDPALSARLELHSKDASTEDLLGELKKTTGLRFTVEDGLGEYILAHPPEFGVLSTRSSSGWSIMELIADRQRIPVRWENKDGGYELVPSARYGHLVSGLAIAASGALVFVLLLMRSPFRRRLVGLRTYLPVTLALPVMLIARFEPQARADDSPDARKTFQRLLRAWDDQRSEILTAELEVNVYRYLDQSSSGLSRAQFLNALSGMRVLQGKLPLESLSSLLPDKNGLRYFQPAPVAVLVNGNSVRNESDHEISIFDGKNEVRYRKGAGGQVEVFSGRSGVELLGLTDLRYVPSLGSPDVPIPTVTPGSAGTLELRWDHMHLRIDASTAMVQRASFQDGRGQFNRDIVHYDFGPSSGGIMFPAVTFDLSYVDGRLKLLSIYEVVLRRLNTEISPERFVLGVPRDTTHVDYRGNRSAPVVASLPASADNVLMVSPQRGIDVPFPWNWFLTTSAGFVLILLGVALYFRRFGKPKESHQ